MVAYLDKTKGNAQFHRIVDFLSCIHPFRYGFSKNEKFRSMYPNRGGKTGTNITEEGVSAAEETLNVATLTVSIVSIQASISTAEISLFLLGVKRMKEKKTTTGKETSNPFMASRLLKNVKDAKVSIEFKFIKEHIRE
nr:hypothetical protein [Tanacetum cinerariifolium]